MADQTFLVGPTLHLRGLERDDAAFESFWNPRPWPRSPETAAERIATEQMESADDQRYTLVACRNRDDGIVGSVSVSTSDWQLVDIEVFVAPIFGVVASGHFEAEILELLMPWLVGEQGAMVARTDIVGNHERAVEAMDRIGARRCYRLREAYLEAGVREDLIGYHLFNPNAVAQFGEPVVAAEGPENRIVRSPAPKAFPVLESPPAGAVALGLRVYLRAVGQDDAGEFSRSALEETETSHDTRWPRSGMLSTSRLRRGGESDLPRHISFAIVLRENDQIIGRNELQYIDMMNRTAETATELFRPAFRSSGLGTEAKHLLLWYAFERLGLHMVRSTVWEINHRSAAALKKQGYREAGAIPWNGLHHGKASGDWMFDLLAAEWQSARR